LVLKTSSYSEKIFGKLYATRAALTFLHCQLISIWKTQRLRLTALSDNQSTFFVLESLRKTETHNPRWRLNRNWELLHGILNDLNGQQLKVQLADSDKERHKKLLGYTFFSVQTYQETNKQLLPRMQPTQKIGRAYLRKGYKIINERYDEEILTLFIWPEFSKHLKKKFNWSTETFESINWAAFRHQATKQTVNRRTCLLKFVYEWLPIGKTLQHIDSSAETKCPSCNAPIETPDHMFCCPTEERKGITQSCIKQVIDLCSKWKTREYIKVSLETSLNFWIAHPSTQPPSAQIVNPEV
jgi:hypothetical protein